MTFQFSPKSLTWLVIAGLGGFLCYHLFKYVEIFKAVIN